MTVSTAIASSQGDGGFGGIGGISQSPYRTGTTGSNGTPNPLDYNGPYVYVSSSYPNFYPAPNGRLVSGKVLGTQCSQTGCVPPTGTGGFTVLVKGTATDGTAVSETDVSGDDGSWSVQVPAGRYTTGLTGDGSTFASKTLEQPDIVVANSPVSGINFTSCVDSAAADTSADHASADGGPQAHAAERSFTPSFCESEYTIKVTAKIPQDILVDASEDAHYQEASGEGYNHSLTFLQVLRQKFRSASGFNAEFPECMKAGKVHAYNDEKATPEWYSYVKAGDIIGSTTVPLTWNQSTQEVRLESVPTVTHGTVTRVFVWQVKLPSGKVVHGDCDEPVQVPMLVLPVAGAGESEEPAGSGGEARDAEAGLEIQDFTIITAWWFPFDSYGATIDPDTSLAERVVDGSVKLTSALFTTLGKEGTDLAEGYERLPSYQRFLAELFVGAALGYAEEKVAVNGARLLAEFYEGRGVTTAELEELEKIGSAIKYTEYGIKVPLEAVGAIEGYTGYPVMSAVIRGSFTTTKVLPSTEAYDVNGKPKLLPYQETLAVTADSTEFPNISMEISRNANKTCFSGCTVYEGLLPWKTDEFSSGPVKTYNPFSTGHPAYFLADSAATKHSYTRGLGAVTNVVNDTSQNPEIANAIRRKGNLGSGFAAAQEDVTAPDCDPKTLDTSSSKTICWEIEDTRP